MKKFILPTLVGAFFLLAAAAPAAISVTNIGPGGTFTSVTNAFTATTAAGDWGTTNYAGAAGTWTTPANMDTTVAGTVAAAVAAINVADVALSPITSGTIAQRSSVSNNLQTKASGNNGVGLMATVQNNTGADQTTIKISYQLSYGVAGNTAAAEELPTFRAYVSLTGLANSWTNIPSASGMVLAVNSPATVSVTLTLGGTWTNGSNIFLLWVDDNGSGTDLIISMDNAVFSVPPAGVALDSPANGVAAAAPAVVSLQATAVGDTFTGVGFYATNGGSEVFLASDLTAPYSVSSSALAAGAYGVYAIATNSVSALYYSSTNVVTITNIPLVAVVTTPTNGQTYLTNEAYLVTATASGSGLSNVLFYVDGALAGSDSTAPYTFNASGLAQGSHTIYAAATNNVDAVGYSRTNTFTVTNQQASLAFNGTSHYVTMGNVAGKGDFNSLSNFTVEFWFVRTGPGTPDVAGAGTAGLGSTAIHGGGAAVPLVCRGDSEGEGSAIDANFYIGIVTNNGVAVLGADIEAHTAGTNGLIPQVSFAAGANHPVIGTNAIVNNVWNHAAVTYNCTNGTWNIYLNGILDATRSTNCGYLPRFDSSQHLALGAALSSGGAAAGRFAGQLDEVRIWKTVRTAAEVAVNKSVRIVSGAGLVARYAVDEGTGTSAFDSAGSGAAGTLTGPPVWTANHAFIPFSVTITNPVNAQSFPAPASVTVEAAATSPNTITNVEFYKDGVLQGNDTTAPYAFGLSTLGGGGYALTAVVQDSSGARATSAVVNITVTSSAGVTLSSPADGASYAAGSTIAFSTFATGAGLVTNLTIYYTNGAVLVTTNSAASPVSLSTNLLDQYPLTNAVYAVAIDDLGNIYYSSTNSFTVTNVPIIVTLTSPTPGQNAGQGQPVNLTATVSGGVAPYSVTFFTNDVAGVVDVSSPYTTAVSYTAVGNYTVSATVTDAHAVTAGTLTNTFTITNVPLSVVLTLPANGASFSTPDAIAISATVVGPAVVNVKFYIDGGLSNTVAFPGPYSYVQASLALSSGAHTIYAQLTDSIGGTTNSITNTFTVAGPIEVTVAGVTNSLGTLPLRSQWASVDIAGATSENATPAAMDITQNLLNAATITNAFVSEAQNTGGNQTPWKWDPTLQYVYNGGASGQSYNLVMGTIKNVTGSTVSSLRIAYDYTIIRSGATEEIPGLRAYYSLTGAPGSWTNLPTLGITTSNAPTTYLSTNLGVTWPANALMYIMWTDDNGAATSGTAEGMYAIDNVGFNATLAAPFVALTSPTNGTLAGAPATIDLTVIAGGGLGTVSSVAYYYTNNGVETHVGTSSAGTSYPVSTATLSVLGNYGFYAIMTNSLGAVTTSITNVVTVGNFPPTVALTAPANGVASCSVTNVTISANATNYNGVTNVAFYVNGSLVGNDTGAPYSVVYSMSPGAYTITAVATDSAGLSSTSAPVLITAPNCPPSAPVLVAPANGATLVSTSPSLQVMVSDPEAQNLTVTHFGRVFEAAPAPGPDFTIVAIPDTQYQVASVGGGTPAMFYAIGDWVATNRASSNIVALFGLGDCTENGDRPSEWQIATNALYRVENPTTTGLAPGVTYQVSLGNHDQGGQSGPGGTTTNFNLYFGTNHFAGKPYYGGNYGTNNNNHYVLFSASGLDFIAVSLEYNDSDATGGTANSRELTNVLAWADALLKTHSNRRAILVSHGIIGLNDYSGAPPANAPFTYKQGSAIFNALANNTNLFLMLCGHHTPAPYTGRRYDTTNGHTIVTLMSDYQSDTNGGSGFVRLYTFSPAKNQIQTQTYSPYFGGFKTDTNNQFTIPYDMTTSAPFVPIGTNTGVASGSTSSKTWAGLANGTKYEWYAVVSDGTNTVTGAVNTFTTALITQQPVSVTTNVGSNVTFSVTAGVAPVKYQWYFGATPVSNATNAAFSLVNVQVGNAGSYYVAVTNNYGFETSSVATLTVNQPPVAGADSLPAALNTAATIAEEKLLENDSDPDGGTLSIVGVNNSANGAVVTRSLGVVTYTPVAGYVGADQFTYLLSDGQGSVVNGVVNVTVTGPAGTTPNIVSYSQPVANGPVTLVFAGIPGRTYHVQATTNIAPASAVNWITLWTTNVGSTGLFQFTDPWTPPPSSRFYRTYSP